MSTGAQNTLESIARLARTAQALVRKENVAALVELRLAALLVLKSESEPEDSKVVQLPVQTLGPLVPRGQGGNHRHD